MALIFSANHEEELRSALSVMRPNVPPRHRRRQKSDAELYALLLLLESIDPTRLVFPLSATKEERPDFVISSSGSNVGIEHTEAVHPDTAESDFLRGRQGLEEPHFITRRIWGEKSTHKKLISEIHADDMGDGWEGDSAEREWSYALCATVENKIQIAKSDGYCRFEENWLLIYDNLELPPIKFEVAAPFLTGEIDKKDAHAIFESIFIVDEHNLFEFRRGSNPTRRSIPAHQRLR